MNIAELLRRAAERAPDKPALVVPGDERDERITYAEFDAAADRVAHGLHQFGIRPGDRVALAMHNVPRFASAYFGILRGGAVAVPLNVMLTEAEVARILADAGARALLGAGPFGVLAAHAAQGVDSVGKIVLEENWNDLGYGRLPDDVAPGEGDLAVLSYTSGTTGEPKGVMLTHGNLLANLDQQMRIPEDRVRPDDVLLLALPLFHIFGLNVTLGLLAYAGATGILLERFEPVAAVRAVERLGATVLFGAPTMYGAWINTPGIDQYDLSSVRLAISGAAPLPPEALKAFSDITDIDVYEGYGLTETAPSVASCRMGPAPRPGSIGLPLPGVEIRLVDERGDDVEVGDPGELLVRGPNVFRGYWNRPEDTERAFTDEWFHTGDVAVRDEEGYLYLVDRKRDLILVSGFNVFPSEVEAALCGNAKVEEAAAVGVPHAYTGEAVKAYVTLVDGAAATEEELLDDVRGRLARFKCPESIEIVDELPHLLTGKVLRRALRD